jgi:capsular exopolysaccharide synthesis family protein
MYGAGRGVEQTDEAGGGPSLDRVLSALRRRWRIPALFALVVGVLAAVASAMMPNRFDATAVVQIDPRKKTISNLESVVSELKADAATVESEVEIIRSRSIALKVIEILKLRQDPEFERVSPLRQLLNNFGLESILGSDDPEPKDGIERLLNRRDPIGSIVEPGTPGMAEPEKDEVAVAFSERLKVGRVRSTLLISIRFSASDPVKAAKIANTVADVYVAEQLAAKQRAAGQASGLLEDKLEQMRSKVADAERRVEEFKARHNIFDSEGQILSEKQMARLMEQTVVARNASSEARAKFELGQRLLKKGESVGAVAEVLQSHTVRLLKEQLAKATRHEAELGTKYGPRHPEMQKVRAEVRDAEAQLSAEIERLVANYKNELEVAENREKQLTQSLEALKQQQITSKDATVELKELQREAATSRQLFEALLTRFKQTNETQDLQLADSRIIEHADVPLFPAAPNRKQITLLALIAGLVAGVGLVLVLEFATTGVGRPEDVERLFDLAHLSSVPFAARPGEVFDRMRSIRLVVAEPSSSYAEAIRGARREIDVRRTHGSARLIQIVSSLPNEGASLVASNLAHQYAITGNRVLLIDGDLRRATLTRELAAGRPTGLLEALAGGQPVETAILRDGRTGLHFLPATGPLPSNLSSAELVSSSAMGAALESLKRQFDTIVMSSPPLLPVIDGRVLADHADQIVFVMTWRKTPKQLAKRALKSLGFNHRKVTGVIMNEVDPEILEDARALGTGLDPTAARRAA